MLPEDVQARVEGPPVGLEPSGLSRGRRRRRPTGAAPPLPRHIGASGKIWLGVLVALLVWVVITVVFEAAERVTERADSAVLEQFARVRTAWLTDLATALNRLGTSWIVTILAVGLIALQALFRRWRHLFIFLVSMAGLVVLGRAIYRSFERPRPFDVRIIDGWAGYSMPSRSIAVLSAVLLGIVYTLVVPGRSRDIAKWVVAAVVTLAAVARLYTAVDHPFDVLVGAALGIAIPLNAFRLFAPNDVFPVTYRRAKKAHLDVGGPRGEAIRRALQDQLGLTVLDVSHIGLEGSGGSTPLRLQVAGEPDRYLFGKLYAMSHVRADRWYKLGRTILYGRLEDETPFQSVRHLVEYEDYALRVLRDNGIPAPASFGIVEITPEREYLLVTEFLDGAREIGDPAVEVDDEIIDEALLLVRQMWDSGLAHRDVKPANLLVRDGQVLLVDAFFVQIRPSPWRQAVDLANMMLVLAVRTDAERVYRRALHLFTPDDIAEAFAAARGAASPTQLRVAMKRDGRNLLAQFRELAPARPAISLQRWSVRRVGLALGLVLAVAFGVSQLVAVLRPAHEVPLSGSPECGTSNMMILMAQSVPSATSLPCVGALPAGWALGDVQIGEDRARFWLDSDRAGDHAVEAALMRRGECDLRGATPVPTDEVGMQRYERPQRLAPGLLTTRYYVFPGGCVTYEFAFDADAGPDLLLAADTALAFMPREVLVDDVDDRFGLRLCGAGAPCVSDDD